MFYDLTDPTTKALYDNYGEDEKDKFEQAYLYMTHLPELIAIAIEHIAKTPRAASIEALAPEIRERLYAMWNNYAQAREGGPDTDEYHSKIISLAQAKQFVTQQVDVKIEVPETVLPYKLAKNIILKNPQDAIAVGTCPCRAANPTCSCIPDPKETCFFIGDPYASFIVAHNPTFRKICQDEAINILEDCHKRGFVSCAYFKRDMGNRMHALCNCCGCCCGGLVATNIMLDGGTPAVPACLPSGLVAQIAESCIGCGACIEKCNFHALRLNEGAARAEVDFSRCMGCGVCEDQCPISAISMRVEPTKGGILDLEELKKVASKPST